MSNYDDDDLYEDRESDVPKKLRAVIKELEKERDALKNEVGTLKASTRQRTLAEEIAKRNLNPKIAALVPKDLEDDALDSWLDEYGDVFGSGGQPAAVQDDRTAAAAAETRRMDQAEHGSAPANPGDLLSAINQASNMDELMAALKSY